jgi:hypothetical protein
MRLIMGACALGLSASVAAGSAALSAGDENPWLISDFRPGENRVLVGTEWIAVTPEVAAVFQQQFPAGDLSRRGGVSGTVSLGRDGAGRAVVTSVRFHK